MTMVMNVNNIELTDFTAIWLPKIALDEIYTYYSTRSKLHTNQPMKI